MLEEQIKKIQDTIENDQSISDAERERLRQLAEELHQELTNLEKTHKEDAANIAEKTHHAVDTKSNESGTTLQDSIHEFEATHPNLVRVVQALCAQFGV